VRPKPTDDVLRDLYFADAQRRAGVRDQRLNKDEGSTSYLPDDHQ
jgi:hypothetical protein